MYSGNKYINQLKVKEFSFYGEPQRKPIKDYAKICQKIRVVCSENREVLSVYTFGEVSVPGISDIDLIFVLKNGSLPGFLKSTSLDRESSYILFHPFFIVTEYFMENISYIYPNSRLKLLYGKKIAIKRLQKKEMRQVQEYLTNDVVLRHFPSDYLNVLLSRKINIRMCLLRLNSMHHSFAIFERISGIKKEEWAKISDDVDKLRKAWFDIPIAEARSRLIELLKKAVYVSLDFVDSYSGFLEGRAHAEMPNLLFKGIQNRMSFVDGWGIDDSLSEMISHFERHKNFYSVFPKALAWQLCAYASAKGPLSSYISKRMSKKCKVNAGPALAKRIQLLNSQVEYAMKLKHSHYPCFFPLGFKNTKGAKNKLIYAYVLVKDHSMLRRIIHFIRSNFRFIPI